LGRFLLKKAAKLLIPMRVLALLPLQKGRSCFYFDDCFGFGFGFGFGLAAHPAKPNESSPDQNLYPSVTRETNSLSNAHQLWADTDRPKSQYKNTVCGATHGVSPNAQLLNANPH